MGQKLLSARDRCSISQSHRVLIPRRLAISCGHSVASCLMDTLSDGAFGFVVGKVSGFAFGKVFKASVCGLLEFVFCIGQFCAQLPNRNVSGGQCAAGLLASQRHHGRHSVPWLCKCSASAAIVPPCISVSSITIRPVPDGTVPSKVRRLKMRSVLVAAYAGHRRFVHAIGQAQVLGHVRPCGRGNDIYATFLVPHHAEHQICLHALQPGQQLGGTMSTARSMAASVLPALAAW